MFSCPKKINRVIAIVVQITRRTSSIKKQILRYYEIRNLISEFGWSVYGHLLKIFLQSCRTCFVRVQRNTLRTFFERSINNIITSGLWDFERKNWLPTGTLSAGLWQVQSTSPVDVYFSFVRVQSNIFRTFSEQSIAKIKISVLWAKKWLPTETLSTALWQVQSASPHQRVEKKLYFWKSYLILSFRFWVYLFRTLSAKIWHNFVKNAFHVSRGPISRSFFGIKCGFICLFGNWAQTTWTSAGFFWQSSRNCNSHM